jgi:hypothetical protein
MTRVQAPGPGHAGQPIIRDAGVVAANRWLVLAIVLAAVFMQLLDTTITTVAVPSIQQSLHTTFGEVQLVLAGYSLAFACVLITGSRLGDIYGRKRLFLIGMVTFTDRGRVAGPRRQPGRGRAPRLLPRPRQPERPHRDPGKLPPHPAAGRRRTSPAGGQRGRRRRRHRPRRPACP